MLAAYLNNDELPSFLETALMPQECPKETNEEEKGEVSSNQKF